MPYYLVCNPAAGDATGKAFTDEHVLPLLKDEYVDLSAPGEVEKLLRSILFNQKPDADSESSGANIDLVVCGGDGTLHDIVDTIFRLDPESFPRSVSLNFAIIPCGTGSVLCAFTQRLFL